MPKSKPPRRKRPRHLVSRDRSTLDTYDRLEKFTDQIEREAEAVADRAPPEEMAILRATCAENRRILAEGRAAQRGPSRTPTLDRLVAEARRRRAR